MNRWVLSVYFDLFDEDVVAGAGGVEAEVPAEFGFEGGVGEVPGVGVPLVVAGDGPPEICAADAVDGFVGESDAGWVEKAVFGFDSLGGDGDFDFSVFWVKEGGIGDEGGSEFGRVCGDSQAVGFGFRVPSCGGGDELDEAFGSVFLSEGDGYGIGIGIGDG